MKSFLTGLAAGVAIGYLTAPRAGNEVKPGKKPDGNELTYASK